VPVLITNALGQARPFSGAVLDRSAGGICLDVKNRLAMGTLLRIRPSHAPDIVPWIQVEVVNSRPADNNVWKIGCQFNGMPADTAFWLFG
jgi:hypothetical protein